MTAGKFSAYANGGESTDPKGKGKPGYLMGHAANLSVKPGEHKELVLKPAGSETLEVTLARPSSGPPPWGVVFIGLSRDGFPSRSISSSVIIISLFPFRSPSTGLIRFSYI